MSTPAERVQSAHRLKCGVVANWGEGINLLVCAQIANEPEGLLRREIANCPDLANDMARSMARELLCRLPMVTT